MTKHTPGPWTLFAKENVTEIVGPDKKPVVTWSGFDDSDRTLKTHRANAKLITAAPELLEELKHALACLMGDEDPRYDQIAAIIKKAGG